MSFWNKLSIFPQTKAQRTREQAEKKLMGGKVVLSAILDHGIHPEHIVARAEQLYDQAAKARLNARTPSPYIDDGEGGYYYGETYQAIGHFDMHIRRAFREAARKNPEAICHLLARCPSGRPEYNAYYDAAAQLLEEKASLLTGDAASDRQPGARQLDKMDA